ncbi:MAG TPA: transglycosylase domain-containing protein [Pyrinomonadaceae bacterium]|jgi:monofunctional biosynthetic peptidoglycan transglycosylase|nr:transglycosylase domain-containing protein [Pyrinomonadaceae bacterium]
MRRIFRWIFLGILGVIVGVIAYDAVLLLRVYRLRSSNPASTSLIDTRAKEARAKGQQPRREQVWVPLERISPNLQRAVLAGEDTNFMAHRGFDYEAIQKAWEQAQREAAREAKREGENDDWLPNIPEFRRGGSTISQQLAKNLYLSSQRSFIRKGQEAIVTIMLERLLTKRRILEIYLNVIEWGDGVYGAEAAAQKYFRKSASSLTANEAAFLSAMIPNPRTVFNPQTNPRRVTRRQRIILRGMPYVRLP